MRSGRWAASAGLRIAADPKAAAGEAVGFTLDGVKRLEDKGVTDVIVGFRIPYIMGQDTEPLDDKIRNLEWFAENVIAKA